MKKPNNLPRLVRTGAMLGLTLPIAFLLGCLPEDTPFMVDEAWSGQTVTVPDGGTLVVGLNATACLDWQLTEVSSDSVVLPIDVKIATPDFANSDIGFSPSCGPERMVTWTFKALACGEGDIRMVLVSRYEPDPYALKEFKLHVLVK